MPKKRRATMLAAAIGGALVLQAGSAAFAEAPRIRTTVVGTAPNVGSLKTCIDKNLQAGGSYRIGGDFPVAAMEIVANQDVDDNINPKGVSVAVVYVNFTDAINLTNALLSGPKATKDPAIKQSLANLITSGGSVERMNVAHLSTADDKQTKILCDALVKEFREHFPVGRGK